MSVLNTLGVIAMSDQPILEVDGLKKYYDTSEGVVGNILGKSQKVKAVDDVRFDLYEGETLGIVGESGCGKTSLGRALLRLIEPTEGSVYYRGQDITSCSKNELRELRKDLQYIFQDPFSSLNPRLTVGDIIGEPLDIHSLVTGQERTDRIYELLEIVGLNASHANRYPHEFSGGQRQRIGIARALAVDPEVIVCDEPVSALDVSVQAQILNLLEDLQDKFGLSYIFIAHDLSVVEHISDRIGVMYLGEIAEIGTTEEVFEPPYHPYAEALLSAIPEPDPLWEGDQIFLSGTVPSPLDPPTGCRFHTRCPRVIQPDTYDLEQGEWRAIMDFRLRLTNARELESVTAVDDEAVAGEELTDPTEVPRNELDRLIRAEFDLPRPISDSRADEVFSTAVDRLFEEDFEGAIAALEETFETPCEVHRPKLLETGGEHQIACHLYDDEYGDRGVRSGYGDVGDATADD